MSRTRKDRPYWVVLNQDARHTDHDHRHLGKAHYRRKYLKDARGEDIYREVDVVGTVDEYLSRVAWASDNIYYPSWRDETRLATDAPVMTYKVAKELHSAGLGNKRIVMARKTERAYETIYSHSTPDRCTAGEKCTRDSWRIRASDELPCSPSLSRGDDGYYGYTRNMSGPKKSYSRERYGHERVTARDALRRSARNWNNGYEVEDWDAGASLTNQHRHSMAWDLW